MTIDMGIAKDLFDVLTKLIEFIKNGYTDNANSRRDFFENHIDATFQLMEKVHTDYLKNFTKLLSIKDKNEITTEKIIDWLKSKKVENQTSRDRISKIEKEVFANKYFFKSFKNDTDISKWTLDFLMSISDYFNDGIYIDQRTWYSALILACEESLRNQERLPQSIPAGLPLHIVRKKDVIVQVENTIGIIVPRFEYILECYSNLKALCLK